MIERLRVRIPAGTAGEFSSLESTLCPFNPRVTAVARKRPRSFYQKYRWQVTPKHAHTLDRWKSEWADYAAVQAECGNLSDEEVGRQHQGMNRPGVRQVPEGSGEQVKMEVIGCEIICGAPTTLAVKG